MDGNSVHPNTWDLWDSVADGYEPSVCWICGKPSPTISLSFESGLHAECSDQAWKEFDWAAYPGKEDNPEALSQPVPVRDFEV